MYQHIDVHGVTRIEVERNPHKTSVDGVRIMFYAGDGACAAQLFVYGTPTLEVNSVE